MTNAAAMTVPHNTSARSYTVAQTCLRRSLSYNQVMRLIYRGDLPGWQDHRGRWHVDADAVDQLPGHPEALQSPEGAER